MGSSRIIGTLFVISGILGIVLLALDQILRSGAPQHYDALIVFVAIDFLVGALAFRKSEGLMLKVAAIWSALRILIQLADVMLGPQFQFTPVQFADYLFNPACPIPASLGNPQGIPAVPIDLILICDIAVLLVVARAGRKK